MSKPRIPTPEERRQLHDALFAYRVAEQVVVQMGLDAAHLPGTRSPLENLQAAASEVLRLAGQHGLGVCRALDILEGELDGIAFLTPDGTDEAPMMALEALAKLRGES